MGGSVSGASVTIPVIVFVKKHSKTSWCDAVPTTQTLHAGSKRFFAFLVGTCTASALALLSQTTVCDTCGSATEKFPVGQVLEAKVHHDSRRPPAELCAVDRPGAPAGVVRPAGAAVEPSRRDTYGRERPHWRVVGSDTVPDTWADTAPFDEPRQRQNSGGRSRPLRVGWRVTSRPVHDEQHEQTHGKTECGCLTHTRRFS